MQYKLKNKDTEHKTRNNKKEKARKTKQTIYNKKVKKTKHNTINNKTQKAQQQQTKHITNKKQQETHTNKQHI